MLLAQRSAVLATTVAPGDSETGHRRTTASRTGRGQPCRRRCWPASTGRGCGSRRSACPARGRGGRDRRPQPVRRLAPLPRRAEPRGRLELGLGFAIPLVVLVTLVAGAIGWTIVSVLGYVLQWWNFVLAREPGTSASRPASSRPARRRSRRSGSAGRAERAGAPAPGRWRRALDAGRPESARAA